ncbi:MAG: MaoC family dehydratase [Rhizobiaceae bacterium]
MSAPANYSVENFVDFVGHDFGVSAPIILDQSRVNMFAKCTGDHQWIHVDEKRAERESPFGTTIAHGYLVISLIAAKQLELGVYPPDAAQVMNYGLGSVRFPAPAKVGSTARIACRISAIEPKGEGRFAVTTINEVRIDGQDKPAAVAEQIAYVMA